MSKLAWVLLPLALVACAVGAFYNVEVSTLVGLDVERESVVHFAALGVPA